MIYMSDRFIFLDRDGTLIKDIHYLHNPADIEFLPYAIEGLLQLQAMCYRFIVVTNQAGIARGYYTLEQAHAVNTAVAQQLQAHGIVTEKSYLCPHHPEFTGPCQCRKPEIGLVTEAAREFHIDLQASIFIGDKDSDTQLGKNCGGTTFLVKNNQYTTVVPADFSVLHLQEVADILQQKS